MCVPPRYQRGCRSFPASLNGVHRRRPGLGAWGIIRPGLNRRSNLSRVARGELGGSRKEATPAWPRGRRSSSTSTGSTALIEREEAEARAQAAGFDRLPRGRRALRRGRRRLQLAGLAARTRSTSTTARATGCGTSTGTSTSTSTWATARWWSATRTRRSSRRSRSRRARGTHFAQPTKDLDVIGENLADRFGAAALALLQLGHRGHARGRAPDAREHRPRHAHQDRGHVPRPPRLADVLGGARTPRDDGPARASEHRAAGAAASRDAFATSSASCRSTTSRPRGARSRRTRARSPACSSSPR